MSDGTVDPAGPAGVPPAVPPAVARRALRVYGALSRLVLPLAFAYLAWRGRAQPGYRLHWAERLGRGAPPPAGDGPWLWLHAVSLGETRAAQPLLEALLAAQPRMRVLLTHMTPTGREAGAEIAARLDPGGARIVQRWLPYDTPGATRRFVAAWRPALGLVMETEIWPNLLAACEAGGVPVWLVNGRLSERSLARGERRRALLAPALARLAGVLVQTPGDAQRFARAGRADAQAVGNLKFDQVPEASLVERGRAWRARLGPRPVVVAASTREGEEAMLAETWREALASRAPAARPRLLVVPRHPQRFEEVAALLGRCFGAAPWRRPALDAPPADGGDVILGDSMGELAAYYASADVAIVGGSWQPLGGQNLIEACAIGVPVLVGPHTFNFAEATLAAIDAGAAVRCDDLPRACTEALRWIDDPARRAAAGEAAAAFASAHRGATVRTLAALEPWLARCGALSAPTAARAAR